MGTELLRPVAKVLQGLTDAVVSSGAVPNAAEGGSSRLDEASEAALDALLISLALSNEGEEGADVEGPPQKLDAAKVLELFSALVPLMEVANGAAQAEHVELNRFLRRVL